MFKIVRGMHLSYLILKIGYNVDIDPLIPQSKFTYFDKYTIMRMQYIKDEHGIYMNKLRTEEPE